MTEITGTRAAPIRRLERDPPRHVILLKQLAACPAQTRLCGLRGAAGKAWLAPQETAASAHDRVTYPAAAWAALAELGARGLTARYQVEGGNLASIAVAEKLGLRRFLRLGHYLHVPGGCVRPGLRS